MEGGFGWGRDLCGVMFTHNAEEKYRWEAVTGGHPNSYKQIIIFVSFVHIFLGRY